MLSHRHVPGDQQRGGVCVRVSVPAPNKTRMGYWTRSSAGRNSTQSSRSSRLHQSRGGPGIETWDTPCGMVKFGNRPVRGSHPICLQKMARPLTKSAFTNTKACSLETSRSAAPRSLHRLHRLRTPMSQAPAGSPSLPYRTSPPHMHGAHNT